MLSRTFIKVSFLGAALLLSACGQDFASVSESRLASKSLEVSEAVKEAEVAMAQVEVAMEQINVQSIDEILLEVDDVTDGANILNLSKRLKEVKSILDENLTPLIGNFGGIGNDLDGLREEIILHIGNLDQNVPADANTILRLEEILERITGLQGNLTGTALGLVDRLDFIDDLLDKVVDKAVGAIGGIGGIPGMLLAVPIKAVLKSIKGKIADKIKQPLVDLITKGFGAVGDIGALI